MAHKITELFKKRNSFPKRNDNEVPETIKTMFTELGQRLDKVEQTLEELVNKK